LKHFRKSRILRLAIISSHMPADGDIKVAGGVIFGPVTNLQQEQIAERWAPPKQQNVSAAVAESKNVANPTRGL
jgi:hypothetical protein